MSALPSISLNTASTITERLSQATSEQLECWAERVLDAPSLDDIFAGN